jgi:hypothetical protein
MAKEYFLGFAQLAIDSEGENLSRAETALISLIPRTYKKGLCRAEFDGPTPDLNPSKPDVARLSL